MRYFPDSGRYHQIELLGLDGHRVFGGGGERVRFRDRQEAVHFLRRLAPDGASMGRLRRLAFHDADSAPSPLLTDDEVIQELAARVVAGAIRVEATPRPRVTPPAVDYGEKEEKEVKAEEKKDHDVEFEITDHWDEPYSDLDWVLIYPDGKTKKTGKLGKDGIVKESSVPPGSYQLVFKIVSAARWGDSRIEVGKEAKLFATAAGHDPGASGKFEIFGDRAVDKKPIAKVEGKVNEARVLEGVWTPDADAVKDVTTGALVFRAKMGPSMSQSSAAQLVVKHSFELTDDDGPLADTSVIARFSDGHEEAAKSKEGKLDVLVPVGQKLIWVHLPDHPGAHITVEPEDGDPMEYLLQHEDEGGEAEAEADGVEDAEIEADVEAEEAADEEEAGEDDASEDDAGEGDEASA